MRVRATQDGNIDRIYKAGEEFTLPKDVAFSKVWMVEVDKDGKASESKSAKKAKTVDPGNDGGDGGISDDQKVAINAALDQLDPANDDHWTAKGQPAMKVLEGIVGDDSITRKMVDEIRPGFERPEK